MPRVTLLICMFVSVVMLTGCNDPALKTSSEEAYKETLKKIYDSQRSEEKRMEIARALVFVATNGSETLPGQDSSKAYDIYHALGFMGNQGRLMALDGKNAAEIVKAGNEARKTWALDNLPDTITNYKKRIDALEKKKAEAAKVEQTHKAASIANVTLDTKEMLAHGTNKSMGFVDAFMVNFDAVNNGSLNIYAYTVFLEIKDSEQPAAGPVRYGDVQVTFKDPVAPGTTRKAVKEIGTGLDRLPYGKDRYVVSAELKRVNTMPDSFAFTSEVKFTEYNEKELAELREKSAAAETELRAYK